MRSSSSEHHRLTRDTARRQSETRLFCITLRQPERGFIIIPVVVALSVLALATYMLASSASQDVRLVAELARKARAESLADGLTRLVVRNLAVNPTVAGRSGDIRVDGSSMTCSMTGGQATVTVASTDGLVNLNHAAPDLLERLFAGVMASDEARRLAQAVVTFRGGVDELPGAEANAAAYESAGLRYGPKNAPFESVGEIDQLPGMTAKLREMLRPMLTVHSRTGIVDPKLASILVLGAIAGVSSPYSDPADPTSLDAVRASLQQSPEFATRTKTRSSAAVVSNTYSIRVAVNIDGTRFTRQAVVDLSGSPETGGRLKEWVSLDSSYHPNPFASAGSPDCLSVLRLDR